MSDLVECFEALCDAFYATRRGEVLDCKTIDFTVGRPDGEEEEKKDEACYLTSLLDSKVKVGFRAPHGCKALAADLVVKADEIGSPSRFLALVAAHARFFSLDLSEVILTFTGKMQFVARDTSNPLLAEAAKHLVTQDNTCLLGGTVSGRLLRMKARGAFVDKEALVVWTSVFLHNGVFVTPGGFFGEDRYPREEHREIAAVFHEKDRLKAAATLASIAWECMPPLYNSFKVGLVQKAAEMDDWDFAFSLVECLCFVTPWGEEELRHAVQRLEALGALTAAGGLATATRAILRAEAPASLPRHLREATADEVLALTLVVGRVPSTDPAVFHCGVVEEEVYFVVLDHLLHESAYPAALTCMRALAAVHVKLPAMEKAQKVTAKVLGAPPAAKQLAQTLLYYSALNSASEAVQAAYVAAHRSL